MLVNDFLAYLNKVSKPCHSGVIWNYLWGKKHPKCHIDQFFSAMMKSSNFKVRISTKNMYNDEVLSNLINHPDWMLAKLNGETYYKYDDDSTWRIHQNLRWLHSNLFHIPLQYTFPLSNSALDKAYILATGMSLTYFEKCGYPISAVHNSLKFLFKRNKHYVIYDPMNEKFLKSIILNIFNISTFKELLSDSVTPDCIFDHYPLFELTRFYSYYRTNGFSRYFKIYELKQNVMKPIEPLFTYEDRDQRLCLGRVND